MARSAPRSTPAKNRCATRKRSCTRSPRTPSRIRFSNWATRSVKCWTSSVSDPGTKATSTLKISEMPAAERPRETLHARGPSALVDPELIAILLGSGVQGANAIEVARQLLEKYQSLTGLSRCTVDELRKIRGIGKAKAMHLVAAFQLGQRLANERLTRPKLDLPKLVYELLEAGMSALHKGLLRVSLLDTRYHHLGTEQISLGSVNERIAHPPAGFRPAILAAA